MINNLEQNPQVQITPYAILAAILFNLNTTETIKVRPDDQAEEIEVVVRPVGMEIENDTCVVMLPLNKIIHFARTVYNYRFQVQDDVAIVSFHKAEAAPALVNSNGTPLTTESPTVQKLIHKMTGKVGHE